MSGLRVAFAGPSGTGKTTLAKYIAERCSIPLNPVGARSVAAAMGFASPYDVDKAGKRAEFQRRLIDEKIAWETGRASFVTDRTPLDNIAYTAMHDVKAVSALLLSDAVRATRRYTHVIRCTMDGFFAPGDDPARITDPTYHKLYEALISGLLDEYVSGARLFTLDDTAREVRQYTVRCVLGV